MIAVFINEGLSIFLGIVGSILLKIFLLGFEILAFFWFGFSWFSDFWVIFKGLDKKENITQHHS